MIVIGRSRIDIPLGRGRFPRAVPRLAAIRKMYILDQIQIRLTTILASVSTLLDWRQVKCFFSLSRDQMDLVTPLKVEMIEVKNQEIQTGYEYSFLNCLRLELIRVACMLRSLDLVF